jgi:hypothetical protein
MGVEAMAAEVARKGPSACVSFNAAKLATLTTMGSII